MTDDPLPPQFLHQAILMRPMHPLLAPAPFPVLPPLPFPTPQPFRQHPLPQRFHRHLHAIFRFQVFRCQRRSKSLAFRPAVLLPHQPQHLPPDTASTAASPADSSSGVAAPHPPPAAACSSPAPAPPPSPTLSRSSLSAPI